MGYRELKFEKNAVFLVTGGAGFIGSNLCEAILDSRISSQVSGRSFHREI